MDNWHNIWMDIAKLISTRSHHPTTRVGAVIVPFDNTQILALGYNGNYRGGPNAPDSDVSGESGLLHAELNAMIKMNPNDPRKKTLYVTVSPCLMCSKMLVNAGINRVIYDEQYRLDDGIKLLRSVGIEVFQIDDETTHDGNARRTTQKTSRRTEACRDGGHRIHG